jgi:DNA-binding IclR family transcriptional regulator
MVLCRGQSLDILQWLSNRGQTPFSVVEFAEGTELCRRTAERWLRDLRDRALVRKISRGWFSSTVRVEREMLDD